MGPQVIEILLFSAPHHVPFNTKAGSAPPSPHLLSLGCCFLSTFSPVLLVFGSHAYILVIGNSAGRLSCPRFSLQSWIRSLVEAAWSSVVPVTNDTPIRLFSRHHICQTNVDSTFMQWSTLLVLWASEGQFESGKKGIETLYNTHPITQGKPNKFIWQKGMGTVLIKEAQATGRACFSTERQDAWKFYLLFISFQLSLTNNTECVFCARHFFFTALDGFKLLRL